MKTALEKIKHAIEYWKGFEGEKQQGIAYGLNLALEHIENNTTPTAKQATSKSLDECKDEIAKKHLHLKALDNNQPYKNWNELYYDAYTHQYWEWLSRRIDDVAELYAKQPHPQDSSSGEVVKCKGNCGMNYCDENGCVESKQHLSEPIPPASESLEQAAKSFLMDRINKHCVVSTGGRLIMLSNPLTADIIVEWIVEFATQQQKPLVVLPNQQFIFDTATKKGFPKGSEGSMKFMFGMRVMLDEIRTRLSAANGVDPIELLKWSLRLTTEERFIHKPHDPRYNDDILRIYNKYLEQSQQQNKGNG